MGCIYSNVKIKRLKKIGGVIHVTRGLEAEALELWRKREYEKAEHTLFMLSPSDRAYPKVILLNAYIQ